MDEPYAILAQVADMFDQGTWYVILFLLFVGVSALVVWFVVSAERSARRRRAELDRRQKDPPEKS